MYWIHCMGPPLAKKEVRATTCWDPAPLAKKRRATTWGPRWRRGGARRSMIFGLSHRGVVKTTRATLVLLPEKRIDKLLETSTVI